MINRTNHRRRELNPPFRSATGCVLLLNYFVFIKMEPAGFEPASSECQIRDLPLNDSPETNSY